MQVIETKRVTSKAYAQMKVYESHTGKRSHIQVVETNKVTFKAYVKIKSYASPIDK